MMIELDGTSTRAMQDPAKAAVITRDTFIGQYKPQRILPRGAEGSSLANRPCRVVLQNSE